MPSAGPVGRTLIESLKELLEARGLSFNRASMALEELGRPIPPLGLSRLASGNRRVDVDELVALAVLLGVSPSALLVPRHVGVDDVVELTPTVKQRAGIVWAWLDGRIPLPGELTESGKVAATPGDKWADYQKHSRPDFQPAEPEPIVVELLTLIRMLETVLGADDGVQPEVWAQWRDTILRRFRLVGIQLEELFARLDREAMAKDAFVFDTAGALDQLQVTIAGVRQPNVPFAPGTEQRVRDGLRGRAYSTPTDTSPHGAPTNRVTDPFGERDE